MHLNKKKVNKQIYQQNHRAMNKSISKEQFSENAIPIKEEMKMLEAEEREQRQIMDAMDAKMDLYKEWTSLLRYFQKESVLSTKIVDTFVGRITVGANQQILVEYSFTD